MLWQHSSSICFTKQTEIALRWNFQQVGQRLHAGALASRAHPIELNSHFATALEQLPKDLDRPRRWGGQSIELASIKPIFEPTCAKIVLTSLVPSTAFMQKGRMDDILLQLGAKVRTLRERRGMSQAELARSMKLSRYTIHRIERGEQNITILTLALVAKSLEVGPATFVDGLPLPEADRDLPPPD